MIETNIAPGLLLAMPQLTDPNFERTAILMIEHQAEGSFGLVMNRASDIPVAAVLSGMDLEWHGRPDAMVSLGGPVMTKTGWLVHEPIDGVMPEAGTLAVADGIAVSMSATMLRRLAERPPGHLRFFIGYAGWGPGQLAAEMVRGSWLHAEATPALIFDTPIREIWTRALRSIGVDPTKVAQSEGLN